MKHTFLIPKDSSLELQHQFFTNQFNDSLTDNCQKVTLKGNLGSLSFFCPISFTFHYDSKTLTISAPDKFSLPLWNSFLSFFHNSLTGVTLGHSLSLSLSGVGYQASILSPSSSDSTLSLSLGFNQPVLIPIPSFILSLKCPDSSTIIGHSYSLPLLSQFFHHIRLIRPSSRDIYKGKGLSISS